MSATTVQSIGALSVLDHDALEHVRHVFAAIGGVFEEVERLLPLHDDDRIALLVEQLADRLLVDAIGFVLEPVDLDGVGASSPLLLLERVERRAAPGRCRR